MCFSIPTAPGRRLVVFPIMLRSLMSMFTSRGLSILFLALCLLDVTATHKPDRVHDGSMIVRPDSELDICGETH